MRDLTGILLGEELTQTERLYLCSMAGTEGFPVLRKLFDQACRIATEDIVKLDPEDERYEAKLRLRQQRARDINEFCEAIRKSFSANVVMARQEEEKKQGEKQNERPNRRAAAGD